MVTHPDPYVWFMCLQGLKEKSLVDATLDKVDALKPIAEELGGSLAQLALAWTANNPNVSTVIMGATKEHQVMTHPPSPFAFHPLLFAFGGLLSGCSLLLLLSSLLRCAYLIHVTPPYCLPAE